MVSSYLCMPVCAREEGRGALGVSCYSILSCFLETESLTESVARLVAISPQRFFCGPRQPYDYGVTMLSIFTCVLGI